MRIEHVRREPSVHLELVGRTDALIEPQRCDTKDFTQRRLLLRRRVVLQPPLELPQDRFLAVAAHTHDERNAELRLVGVVEAMKGGELSVAQPIEPRACLFGGRVGAQLPIVCACDTSTAESMIRFDWASLRTSSVPASHHPNQHANSTFLQKPLTIL